jgi:AcrR family transcriptional regulator
VTSIWLRTPPDRQRRQPQLNRELITATAVELLDVGGIDGLTMRRLAERLGVTSTALYWHVTTKDDVLDLAVDWIFGEVEIPGASAGAVATGASAGPGATGAGSVATETGTGTGDWRADVRTLAGGWRRAMLAHPWAPQLIGRPMLGPNVLARTEFLQHCLRRGGLAGRELTVTTRLVANYVIGAALTESAWQAADVDDRAAARRHVTEAYPTLRSARHLDEPWGDDELFRLGLDKIITG